MVLRSYLYSVLFFLVSAVMAIVLLPALLFGRDAALAVAKLWTRTLMALHRAVTGIGHEFRNFDQIPQGAILAVKHQSTWETLALVPQLATPAFILKRELMWIPVFGWWLKAAGNIPIDRGNGAATLIAMNKRAAEALKDGRQIIIFPEGTRRPAGAPPDYKSGLGLIYKALNAPIVPIALNSGTAWPRKTRVQRAGTIVAEALEIIPPGLPPRQALKLVQERIETACDRLLLEADARGDDLPDSAKARVAVLRASEPAA
jgi:1-acyl-sn-glycerol-3-phosphate acyltransferase